MGSVDFLGCKPIAGTKPVCVPRPCNHEFYKRIVNEKVRNFKYLGVDINYQSGSHEETCRRIVAKNKCRFS